MSNYRVILVSVLVVYLAANLAVGLLSGKNKADGSHSFINNYFIGGRSMGGIVLAMTLVATFASASSFIGGPGVASSKGLVWVYLSMIQVPTAFIVLALLGKKFALISRKTGAVTVSDYLRARYKSEAVVIVTSVAMVLFFLAQMMSQFLGGAILFQTVTGLNYVWGLALFAFVVIVYTVFGGFRAVVITDTIQGFVMILGSIILLVTVVVAAGGFDLLTAKMAVASPDYADITAGGSLSQTYVLSFWVLVGVGVLGLPQTAVRGMGFKDTKALHNAIIYGTIISGFIMLAMHLSGVFAPAVIDTSALESSDYVVAALVMQYMNPVVAGIFIAAPLAAVMSTVSSLLILASATIIKDLYLHYIVKEGEMDSELTEKRIPQVSRAITLLIGVIVFVMAIYPPDLIVWINLFAMGGLECAFFAPIILGLYWQRANATGALLSAVMGISAFLIISVSGWSMAGTHAVVPSLAIAVIAFVIGSLLGKRPDDTTRILFFGE